MTTRGETSLSSLITRGERLRDRPLDESDLNDLQLYVKDSLVELKDRSEDAHTVKSLATMLGWENVPPRHILEADIRALKARVAESRLQGQAPHWQPIDTAPKDETPVLVAFIETGHRKRSRKPYVGEAEYRNGGWWWPNEFDAGYINPTPTHWMSLPAPPDPEGQAPHQEPTKT